MTYLIGLILVVVFLAFASLMFLERLSALLALPLMAMTFLLISVGADLAEPTQTDHLVSAVTSDPFGRVQIEVKRERGPSRFAQWKQVRAIQGDLLREKIEWLDRAVQRLQTDFAGRGGSWADRLRQTLVALRAEEEAFDRQAAERLDELTPFFFQPPHYGGQRARFEEQFAVVTLSPYLRNAASALDEHRGADAAFQIEALLQEAREESRRRSEEYSTRPNPQSRWFRIESAFLYLMEYVFLVLRAGSLRLAATIIATIFGGMFAVYAKNLKVAERLVYWTAEFAGERPFVIACAVFVVTAGIFTSIGGLGTVIMLGTIILPILRSVGLGPIVSAGAFLIAIAMGGTLQPVSRRLWMDFYNLPAAQLDPILWTMVGLYFVCGVGWIWWGARRSLLSSFSAVAMEKKPPDNAVPARLMVAPLIPVVLVYFADVDEIAAFTISIAYMFVCVCARKGAARVLARSLIEGAQMVMPPVLLMLGIGILITALATPPVQSHLRPLLSAAVPRTQLAYILVFSLAAPLALYRGPLNVWGMGLAVSAILLAISPLPAAAVLGAILAAGMLQGVCDPTNTANVWIAGFQGVTVNQILRYTLLPVWAMAIVAVVIFGLRFLGG